MKIVTSAPKDMKCHAVDNFPNLPAFLAKISHHKITTAHLLTAVDRIEIDGEVFQKCQVRALMKS